MMYKDKGLSPVKRFVVPTLAILGCLVMVVAAFVAHLSEIPGYLIIFAVIMLIGIAFIGKKKVSEA
jgi:APA family basic amino acid/polyamine antiporter